MLETGAGVRSVVRCGAARGRVLERRLRRKVWVVVVVWAATVPVLPSPSPSGTSPTDPQHSETSIVFTSSAKFGVLAKSLAHVRMSLGGGRGGAAGRPGRRCSSAVETRRSDAAPTRCISNMRAAQLTTLPASSLALLLPDASTQLAGQIKVVVYWGPADATAVEVSEDIGSPHRRRRCAAPSEPQAGRPPACAMKRCLPQLLPAAPAPAAPAGARLSTDACLRATHAPTTHQAAKAAGVTVHSYEEFLALGRANLAPACE